MQQSEQYSGVENLEIMREARNYNRFLLETVRRQVQPRARIIDFGAGNGEFATPLTAQGADLTAVEPDTMLLGRLRAGNVRAVADARELPDAAFDYIYTLNVLEHIEDHVAALKVLHAKLRWRGTLLVYVPAFPALYTSMDARVGHVRRYTRRTLLAAVAAAGFSVRKVAYVDSIGFFAALLFKYLGSQDGNISAVTLKAYDRLIFPLSRVLDLLTQRWFGKNLLLLADKP